MPKDKSRGVDPNKVPVRGDRKSTGTRQGWPKVKQDKLPEPPASDEEE